MMFETLTLDHPEKEKFLLYNGQFNWTMTYRRDSDIFIPYGRFISNSIPRPLFNETWAYIRGAKGENTYINKYKNLHYVETPSIEKFQ